MALVVKASEELKEIRKQKMEEVYQYRKMLYERPQLRHLFLEVTSRCNARCEHCGSSCGYEKPKNEVSKEKLMETLKEISEHYNARDILLNVTGGEPFLRKDLFEIMDYAVSLGFNWGITSNGILIDEELVKKIVKSKMSTISISIDGLKETHEAFRKVPGAWEKIIKGIKLMLKEPSIKCVQVTTVANKKNMHELEELYKVVQELGVKYWRVVNCDPIGRAKNNDDILLDAKGYRDLFKFIYEKRKENKLIIDYGCSHYLGLNTEMELRNWYFFCMTGLYVGSILSNGDIFVCPNVERRPELIQGNINTDSFVEVWENKFKPFRHEKRTSCEECLGCSHFKYCGGDSFHTWNFDDNKPNICIKKIYKEEDLDKKEVKKTTKKKNETTKKSTTKKKTTSKKSTKKSAKKDEKKVVEKKKTTKKVVKKDTTKKKTTKSKKGDK